MKVRYPSFLGILVGMLLVCCFILPAPALVLADSSIDVSKAEIDMPAMLSSPNSADLALSASNGEIAGSASITWVNVIGVVFLIFFLIPLTILVVAAVFLEPILPPNRYYIIDSCNKKLRELSGDTDQEEVITHNRAHGLKQPFSPLGARPAS